MKVKKSRYGVYIAYVKGKGKPRRIWTQDPQAQEEVYRREKKNVGNGTVQYVKKMRRL